MANLDLIDETKLGSKQISIRRDALSKDLILHVGQTLRFAGKGLLHGRCQFIRESSDFEIKSIVDYLGNKSEYKIQSISEAEIVLELVENLEINVRKPITLILGFVRPRIVRKIFELASVLPIREIVLYHSDLSDSSYLLSSEYGEFLIKERLKYSVCQSGIPYVPHVKIIEHKNLFYNKVLPLLAGYRLLGDSMSSFSMINLLKLKGKEKCVFDNEGFSLFIGPERGFSEIECRTLIRHEVNPINIGAEIYQVDSAVIAICSQLNFIFQMAGV